MSEPDDRSLSSTALVNELIASSYLNALSSARPSVFHAWLESGASLQALFADAIALPFSFIVMYMRAISM